MDMNLFAEPGMAGMTPYGDGDDRDDAPEMEDEDPDLIIIDCADKMCGECAPLPEMFSHLQKNGVIQPSDMTRPGFIMDCLRKSLDQVRSAHQDLHCAMHEGTSDSFQHSQRVSRRKRVAATWLKAAKLQKSLENDAGTNAAMQAMIVDATQPRRNGT